MQKVMSNTLDIDFIHGYIHDRSCKKICSWDPLIFIIGSVDTGKVLYLCREGPHILLAIVNDIIWQFEDYNSQRNMEKIVFVVSTF